MRRFLETQRQADGEIKFPPFAQQIFERGELKGKRDMLLRLLARTGIALTHDERARIVECSDTATLDRWFDNVLRAKSASDVLC